MSDLETRLREIVAREKAATPGDWGVDNVGVSVMAAAHEASRTTANAVFVSHARQDVPFLLSLLREMALGALGCEETCDWQGESKEVSEWEHDPDCTNPKARTILQALRATGDGSR